VELEEQPPLRLRCELIQAISTVLLADKIIDLLRRA
jgi:hypothetical protein